MTSAAAGRSALFAVLLVFAGVALLVPGLRWYHGHLERLGAGTPRSTPPSLPTPMAPATPRAPDPPAPPSPEELAGLASSDGARQLEAIATLLKRRMTPELVLAIHGSSPANPGVAEKLQCLQARIPGPESLAWTIAQLPTKDAPWPSNTDRGECLVRALADRVGENPERVVEALFPFSLSYPARIRGPALRGLSEARLRSLPPGIRSQIAQAWHSGLAVRAAFALRIEELDPRLVEGWLFDSDDSVRHAARSSLVASSAPAAARLLVRGLLARRNDRDLLDQVKQRDLSHHDASTQLVEVALDENETTERRGSALELLATVVGDAETADRLVPLLGSADPVLRAYAEAASAELRKRHPARNRPQAR